MELKGNNIYIRFLEDVDAEQLLALHIRNRVFFQKYSPACSDEYYTLEATRGSISRYAALREEGRGYSFGIFRAGCDELIGTVSLASVVRGPLQKCMIGYSLDQSHNGHGYTTEAVKLAVRYAFEELKLHRVEAGAMPENIGSLRVLAKAGFQKEGIERKGVEINGQWQDHQILSILAGDV